MLENISKFDLANRKHTESTETRREQADKQTAAERKDGGKAPRLQQSIFELLLRSSCFLAQDPE